MDISNQNSIESTDDEHFQYDDNEDYDDGDVIILSTKENNDEVDNDEQHNPRKDVAIYHRRYSESEISDDEIDPTAANVSTELSNYQNFDGINTDILEKVDDVNEYEPLKDEEYGEYIGYDNDVIDSSFLLTNHFAPTFSSITEVTPENVLIDEDKKPIEQSTTCIPPLTKEKIDKIKSIMSTIQLKPNPGADMIAMALTQSKIRRGDEI